MEITTWNKPSFVVIGKEGSTNDGDGFILQLWEQANSQFHQVEHLAKRDDNGNFAGFWGAMSDLSRSFQPWQDGFSKGLYLAGVECVEDAVAPEGWSQWVVPGFEYLRVQQSETNIFPQVISYMKERGLSLAGAVHDFTDPAEGTSYSLFPIVKL